VFNKDYNFVFNSYYETVGARVIRTDRGNLSRPSVEDIYQYRKYVDKAMAELLSREPPAALRDIVLLGLNHEQQHQELLWSDIKYILGHNPLFPAWSNFDINDPGKTAADLSPLSLLVTGGEKKRKVTGALIPLQQGIYEIGYKGEGFCFDNELSRHKVWL